MPLNHKKIEKTLPTDRPQRLFDERGLYLEISPAGGKWWRLKYRFKGKEKRLSLGVFPAVSLKQARNRRDEARKLAGGGRRPERKSKSGKVCFYRRRLEQF